MIECPLLPEVVASPHTLLTVMVGNLNKITQLLEHPATTHLFFSRSHDRITMHTVVEHYTIVSMAIRYSGSWDSGPTTGAFLQIWRSQETMTPSGL